jgi:hypothetical protein
VIPEMILQTALIRPKWRVMILRVMGISLYGRVVRAYAT